MTVLAATAATQQQLAAGVPAPQRKAQRSGGQLSGAPGSPGRSASPRSATSMAYLGQPGTLAPSRPRHQQHSPLAKASQEWEGDLTLLMQKVHTSCCSIHSPQGRAAKLPGKRLGDSTGRCFPQRRLLPELMKADWCCAMQMTAGLAAALHRTPATRGS